MRLLAEEFLQRFAKQNGKTLQGFDDDAMEWILAYHWPGNVRELKNAIERAVIMSRGPRISASDVTPRHLRQSGEIPSAVTISVGSSVADARRQLVLRTFASTGGDVERSAKTLGISRSMLYRLIARFRAQAELTTLLPRSPGRTHQPH